MWNSWLSQRRRIVLLASVLVCLTVVGQRIYLWRQISVARQTLSTGHLDVAITMLERTAAFAPDNAEVHYLLAVAERRSGHLDRVSPLLQRAARLGWSKDDIERQSLLVIAQNGDIAETDARLKTIMIRGVSDEVAEEIYEALAIGYLKTYRLKEAWECLSSWSSWQPQAIFPKIWRADICHRINNRAGEESEHRAILAIDPKHCETRRRLADLLKDSNRVEEARKEYEHCLQTSTATPDVLIGLAECHRRLAQTSSAVSLLKQALDRDLSAVQHASVLCELGQIAADEGRFHEAITNLDKATRLAPLPSTDLVLTLSSLCPNGRRSPIARVVGTIRTDSIAEPASRGNHAAIAEDSEQCRSALRGRQNHDGPGHEERRSWLVANGHSDSAQPSPGAGSIGRERRRQPRHIAGHSERKLTWSGAVVTKLSVRRAADENLP